MLQCGTLQWLAVFSADGCKKTENQYLSDVARRLLLALAALGKHFIERTVRKLIGRVAHMQIDHCAFDIGMPH